MAIVTITNKTAGKLFVPAPISRTLNAKETKSFDLQDVNQLNYPAFVEFRALTDIVSVVVSMATIEGSVAETTTIVNLYVDTSGNDSTGDGSYSAPFSTIQRALDNVPDFIKYPVYINVGPGSYTGFRIDNKIVSKPIGTGSYLAILGTLGTYTPTQGPSTGTISSLSAVGGTGLSTFQIVGANWVVDELKGKFITNSTTGTIREVPIISNTADTITFYGQSTYFTNGQSVIIVEPKTTINAPNIMPQPATLSPGTTETTLYSGSEAASLVKIANCNSAAAGNGIEHPAILLANMIFTTNTALIFRLRIARSTVMLRTIITGGTGNAGHIQCSNSFTTIHGWVSNGSGGSPTASSSTYGFQDMLNISLAFLERSTFSTAMTGFRHVILTDVYIKGFVTGISMQDSSYTLTRVGFDGCTTGISANQGNNYTKMYNAYLAWNSGFINNATMALDMKGKGAWAHIRGVVGTGNTALVSAKFGAAIGLRNDVSAAATTEITLDAATSTLASMRAASPKVVRDANYGSIVYEADA